VLSLQRRVRGEEREKRKREEKERREREEIHSKIQCFRTHACFYKPT
jgi:hypothetical protein